MSTFASTLFEEHDEAHRSVLFSAPSVASRKGILWLEKVENLIGIQPLLRGTKQAPEAV